MIQDLHSHTYYSFCGKDNPESIINAAINGGIAHTDMFSFVKNIGEDPYKYFKKMAEQNIFWEQRASVYA